MNIWYYVAPKADGTGGFKRSENWGDPYKINGVLLLTVYALRQYTGWPIFINNAFATSGHAIDSQHYIGNAADCHFDFKKSKSPVPKYQIQIKRIVTFLGDFQLTDRVGLGIYPTWDTPGFHLDVRGRYARWGWLGEYDDKGKPVYEAFNKVLDYIKENDL